MDSNVRRVIEEQQSFEKVIVRDVFDKLLETLSLEEVTTVIGPRRAGKSSALKWLVAKEGGVYVNFEDVRLPREGSFILEIAEEWDKGIIALDEVHLVKGWEKAVATLMKKRKVFVSGSTAHLLSREYGTYLTGRHVNVEVFPLSYKEFLSFGGRDYEHYLSLGSYPRVVLTGRKHLLGEYFKDVVYRDVAVRFRTRFDVLEELAAHLLAHSSKRFSERRLSTVFDVSPNTVGDMVYYLEEAFLVERSLPYHPKISVRKRLPFKVYGIDHGYVSHFLPDKGWKGRALETAIYWEFRRHFGDIFYYYQPEGDIVIQRGNKAIAVVNVVYSLTEENREREEKISQLRVPVKALVALEGDGERVDTYRPWEVSSLISHIWERFGF